MRRYLITGAGSGIGQKLAVLLASDPANQVILMGRTEEKLKSTLKLLAHPDQHKVIVADASDGGKLRSQLTELPDLYAVFANAGVSKENHYGKGDTWSEVIGSNLTGTYVTVSEALPYLKKCQEPYKHILLTSSVLAHMGVPGHSAYCASKAGQLGLMRSWAIELASKNILVNAICPGWVETDMAKSSIQRLSGYTQRSYEDEYRKQMNLVPLKKSATPEEVARLMHFLTSPDQTSITGEEIQINNGAYLV